MWFSKKRSTPSTAIFPVNRLVRLPAIKSQAFDDVIRLPYDSLKLKFRPDPVKEKDESSVFFTGLAQNSEDCSNSPTTDAAERPVSLEVGKRRGPMTNRTSRSYTDSPAQLHVDSRTSVPQTTSSSNNAVGKTQRANLPRCGQGDSISLLGGPAVNGLTKGFTRNDMNAGSRESSTSSYQPTSVSLQTQSQSNQPAPIGDLIAMGTFLCTPRAPTNRFPTSTTNQVAPSTTTGVQTLSPVVPPSGFVSTSTSGGDRATRKANLRAQSFVGTPTTTSLTAANNGNSATNPTNSNYSRPSLATSPSFCCNYESVLVSEATYPFPFPDPLQGAPTSLQSRVYDLDSLQNDTVRWERAKIYGKRRTIRPSKQDSS